MTRLEESFTVVQRQLANAQSDIVMVEAKCDECRRRLGVKEQLRDGSRSCFAVSVAAWSIIRL